MTLTGTPQNVFDSATAAERYDQWYAHPVGAAYDRLERRAIEAALPDPAHGRRLLEVGCGTGHWTEFFTTRGFDVTAVDLSRPMLARARRKARAGVALGQADAARLPFADGVFDVAVAVTVLEFVADALSPLAEMARCVRPGGKLIIGALNRWSLLGLLRRLRHVGRPSGRRSATFAKARFFTTGELRRMCAPYGRRVRVSTVAFILPWRWALGWAPWLDRLGRALGLSFGDFIVAEVWR